jgi:propionyl-CoA carboxylase beta chain
LIDSAATDIRQLVLNLLVNNKRRENHN